jgi:hypothetical protein
MTENPDIRVNNPVCRMNRQREAKGRIIMLHTVLIVLLILFLVGALPTWPHSANWGYGPSGGLSLILLILVILLLTGRLGGRKRS